MKRYFKKLLILFLALGVLASCSKKQEEKTSEKQTEQKKENTTTKQVNKQTVFVDADYVKDVIDGKNADSKKFV